MYSIYVSRQERTSTILNDCSDDYRGRFSTRHDYYVHITLVCCAVLSGNPKSKKFFFIFKRKSPSIKLGNGRTKLYKSAANFRDGGSKSYLPPQSPL